MVQVLAPSWSLHSCPRVHPQGRSRQWPGSSESWWSLVPWDVGALLLATLTCRLHRCLAQTFLKLYCSLSFSSVSFPSFPLSFRGLSPASCFTYCPHLHWLSLLFPTQTWSPINLLHVWLCLVSYSSEVLNECTRPPHSTYEMMSSNVSSLAVEYLSWTQCFQGLPGEGREGGIKMAKNERSKGEGCRMILHRGPCLQIRLPHMEH